MRFSSFLVPIAVATTAPMLISATTTTTAFAQGKDPAAADALFREGRKLLQAGNLSAACPKLEESYRLDPQPGTLLNVADCEEKQGKLSQAWQHFRDSAEGLRDPKRAEVAQKRAEALQKRLAFVTFKLDAKAPASTRVLRDDIELSSASFGLALPMNPGKHSLRVVGEGGATSNITLDLAEGETREVVLEPPPPASVSPTPTPTKPVTPATTPTGQEATPRAKEDPNANANASASTTKLFPIPKERQIPVYASLGVGALGLVTLGIGVWQVFDAKSVIDQDCVNNVCNSQEGIDAGSRGKTFTAVMIVGAAVTVVGIGGAALFLFWTKNILAVVAI